MSDNRVLVITNDIFYRTLTPGKALVLLRRVTDAYFPNEETYPVHGIDQVYEVPRVIHIYRSLGKFNYHQMELKFSKIRVFRRDHYTCAYCGRHLNEEEATLDHVIPKSRGGLKDWRNVVTACRACNKKKDNHTPEEAAMALLYHPKVPTYAELYGEVLARKEPIPAQI